MQPWSHAFFCALPARILLARILLAVGVPAAMDADAWPGFPPMGFQPSYVALELRGGRKDKFLRIVIASSRGSEAAHDAPTQHGNVGFCVSCARITHNAAPIIYSNGLDDWLKGMGVSLRKKHVPCAPWPRAMLPINFTKTTVARPL